MKTKPNVYAIDFGTGVALQIWGPDGRIKKSDLRLSRVPGGKTPRDEFIHILEALLKLGDVVVESPTVGASGALPADVLRIVAAAKHTLFTVSARAVKNYRKDHGLAWVKGGRYGNALMNQEEAHVEDAQIIYALAIESPERLRRWHLAERIERKFTSVRPEDKNMYRGCDAVMKNLPPFGELPPGFEILGNEKGYRRTLAYPFALAFMEPSLWGVSEEQRRNWFAKILGLYDHGYPSFYRRTTVSLMQDIAKSLAGVTRMEEVPKAVRKEAWKDTQRLVRRLFHIVMDTKNCRANIEVEMRKD